MLTLAEGERPRAGRPVFILHFSARSEIKNWATTGLGGPDIDGDVQCIHPELKTLLQSAHTPEDYIRARVVSDVKSVILII